MSPLKLKSRVGSDGVLRIDLTIGQADADREVELTIEPVAPTGSDAEYQEFLRSTAGAWQGDFERFPQGDYETREALS